MSIIKVANRLAGMHDGKTSDGKEEYYNHVAGSSKMGAAVGGVPGTALGALAGSRVSHLKTLSDSLAKNPASSPFIKRYKPTIDEISKRLPTKKKAISIGAGIGGALGMADGSYKGMMSGIQMNDRQYLLGRNLKQNEIVNNQVMGSLNANSTGGRLSNATNQTFGRVVGSLRRTEMDNRKDGSLKGLQA